MSDPTSAAGSPSHPSVPAAGGAAEARPDAARRAGLLGRIARRTRADAEIVVPAIPSLIDHHVDMLADHFAALGRPFSADELATLRQIVLDKSLEGFQTSQYSNVFIRYSTAGDGSMRIEYAVAAATSSLAEEYEHWVKTRQQPMFGVDPDARVMAALAGLEPGAVCLDVGAGTGRNALPIARRGFEVVAVEAAPALADVLEAAAAQEGLPVRVVRADVLSPDLPLPRARCALAVVSQVTSHFRGTDDLRALLATVALALAPGGHALITVFLTAGNYRPDRLAREVGQACWSTFFTADDLKTASEGLPLSLVSDEDALAFERAHHPADRWPPTGWYEMWAQGHDVFGPHAPASIMLRWLLFRRTPGEVPGPR